MACEIPVVVKAKFMLQATLFTFTLLLHVHATVCSSLLARFGQTRRHSAIQYLD